ncbi:hypothetical protein B0H13DRAFT_2303444 [Mycena leptocephala]|nr:hypothetical protein B0H13DRAFT_2303444 [Mycena leptocephala]
MLTAPRITVALLARPACGPPAPASTRTLARRLRALVTTSQTPDVLTILRNSVGPPSRLVLRATAHALLRAAHTGPDAVPFSSRRSVESARSASTKDKPVDTQKQLKKHCPSRARQKMQDVLQGAAFSPAFLIFCTILARCASFLLFLILVVLRLPYSILFLLAQATFISGRARMAAPLGDDGHRHLNPARWMDPLHGRTALRSADVRAHDAFFAHAHVRGDFQTSSGIPFVEDTLSFTPPLIFLPPPTILTLLILPAPALALPQQHLHRRIVYLLSIWHRVLYDQHFLGVRHHHPPTRRPPTPKHTRVPARACLRAVRDALPIRPHPPGYLLGGGVGEEWRRWDRDGLVRVSTAGFSSTPAPNFTTATAPFRKHIILSTSGSSASTTATASSASSIASASITSSLGSSINSLVPNQTAPKTNPPADSDPTTPKHAHVPTHAYLPAVCDALPQRRPCEGCHRIWLAGVSGKWGERISRRGVSATAGSAPTDYAHSKTHPARVPPHRTLHHQACVQPHSTHDSRRAHPKTRPRPRAPSPRADLRTVTPPPPPPRAARHPRWTLRPSENTSASPRPPPHCNSTSTPAPNRTTSTMATARIRRHPCGAYLLGG